MRLARGEKNDQRQAENFPQFSHDDESNKIRKTCASLVN
jgi:hypothetical protein